MSTVRSVSAWGRSLGTTGERGLVVNVEGGQGDFALALQGRLQETIDQQLKDLHGAYWRAMNRVVEAGKGRLRQDIIGGGFHRAQALANTWRGNVYPREKNSLEVAGWLYNRARQLIEVFESGTVIKVRGNAQFLAIPVGPSKAIVRRLQAQKKKGLSGRDSWGRFQRDDSYVDQVARALGVDLVPIIAKDRQTGVLVAADNRTLTPSGRDAKNQTRAPTPLFALAKTATLRKRIRGQALVNEILSNFPDDFTHALMGELAVAQRGDG